MLLTHAVEPDASEVISRVPCTIMGVWRPCPSGIQGIQEALPSQKLMTLSENMLFCHGCKDDSDICIHCLQVFSMNTHTQLFYGPFSGTTRLSRCQKKSSSGLFGAMKITEADTLTIWTNHSQRPTSIIPPFLCRMLLLPEPSHFISAWDRHQICIAIGVVCVLSGVVQYEMEEKSIWRQNSKQRCLPIGDKRLAGDVRRACPAH